MALKSTLRIAEFVSSEVSFPIPRDFPRPYAPLSIALDIARGLAGRGHEVVFFGPQGSRDNDFQVVEAPFAPLYKNEILDEPDIHGIEREKIFNLFDQHIISSLFKKHQTHPFDIIHIHPVDRALPFAVLFPHALIVYTLHDPVYRWRKKVFEIFSFPNQYFVSLSNAQRIPASGLNYLATIYNGIDTSLFPFSDAPGSYLFFSGRLQENKGVFEAIQVARVCGERLLIAGAPAEGLYWEKKIKPYLGDRIQYIGFKSISELGEYYKNAKATLVPIRWEEPFGLVAIESMACGTPVIAFRRGSMPEVVEHGKTGFIVDTIDEMADAVKKIDTINRSDCRVRVNEKFSTEHMVDRYEEEFRNVSG